MLFESKPVSTNKSKVYVSVVVKSVKVARKMSAKGHSCLILDYWKFSEGILTVQICDKHKNVGL